jgi:hypothetical protein
MLKFITMQKSFLLALFMALAMNVCAQNYLHVQTADGWKLINLDNVERITFAGGVMTATDASNTIIAQLNQQKLESMYVDDEENVSGLKITKLDQGEATLSFDANKKVIKVLTDGSLDVFTVTGVKILTVPNVKKGEIVDVSQLAVGTAIFKNGTFSLKTILK